MTAGTVARNRAALRKDDAKRALAAALSRLVLAHGLGTVADQAGCCTKTISNAMGLRALPELHIAANLLLLDPSALDELLALLGFRLVPSDAATTCFPSVLADLAGVTATTAAALADGRVDHLEEARIVAQVRDILPELNAMAARHDARKVGAK